MTTNADPPSTAAEGVFNLSGQRLGRKGQETRERIIKAMQDLLTAEGSEPITLRAVARTTGVGMSTLYLYFPDLGELLIAVLDRAMNQSDQTFFALLRGRWPDEAIGDCAREFVRAYFDFWRRHARLLQMRNSFADAADERLIRYRYDTLAPIVDLLVMQMDAAGTADVMCHDCAAVLLTSLERVATIFMATGLPQVDVTADGSDQPRDADRMAIAQAKVIEVMIVAMRARDQSEA